MQIAGVTLGACTMSCSDPTTPCDRERALVADAPRWSGDGARIAAILGDSWTVGEGLEEPSDSFAYLLAARSGWRARIAGDPGTGFTTAGDCGTTYLQRVSSIPRSASIVVLQGGVNDVARDPDLSGFRAAVALTVRAINERVREATVVVLAVPRLTYPSRARLEKVNRRLHQAARETGATWVAGGSWRLALQDDGTHPTGAGHRQFARRIAGSLDDRLAYQH